MEHRQHVGREFLDEHFAEAGNEQSVSDKIFADYSKAGAGLMKSCDIPHQETVKEKRDRLKKERHKNSDFVSDWWSKGYEDLGKKAEVQKEELR